MMWYMGGGTILWLMGGICLAVFGGALRQAFQALEAKKYRSMWNWYVWTFFASGVLCFGWAIEGDQSVVPRNIILGLAGAAVGCSVSIWAGYVAHDMRARAQPVPLPREGRNMNDTPNPLSPPTGNFSYNQQGGITNQTYINQAPPDLTFTPQLGVELLDQLPKDKPIHLVLIGAKQSDLMTVTKIREFLIANGYEITFASVMQRFPPPEQRIIWDPAALVLTVTPSITT